VHVDICSIRYQNILDLCKLVDAMYEEGFKRSEIGAFFGGSLLRVMQKSIG